MLSSLRSNNHQLVKSIFHCSKHFVAYNNTSYDMINQMVRQDCQMIGRGALIKELYKNNARKKLIADIAIKNSDSIKEQQGIINRQNKINSISTFLIFMNMGLCLQNNDLLYFLVNSIAGTTLVCYSSEWDETSKKLTNDAVYGKILPVNLKKMYEKNMIEIIQNSSQNKELGFCKTDIGKISQIAHILVLKKRSIRTIYINWKNKNFTVKWGKIDDKEYHIFYKDSIDSDRMFIFHSPTTNYIFSGLSDVEMAKLLLDAYKLIPYDDKPFFHKKSYYGDFFEKE